MEGDQTLNRMIVSVPRVLDHAMVVTQDNQLSVPTGTVPATAVEPFVVNKIVAVSTETQMSNITITPLGDNTNCSRVTATVQIPLTITITDANSLQFETHTNLTRNISVVLYIPDATAFPYTITAEGAFGFDHATATIDTTTITCASTKILIRVTATTDLLIPTYGYAPLQRSNKNQLSDSQNFLQQPLFPRGRVY